MALKVLLFHSLPSDTPVQPRLPCTAQLSPKWQGKSWHVNWTLMQQDPRKKRFCFSPLESSQPWVIKCNYSQPAITGMAMPQCSSPSALSQPTPTIQKQTQIQTKVPKMTSSRDAPHHHLCCPGSALLVWKMEQPKDCQGSISTTMTYLLQGGNIP